MRRLIRYFCAGMIAAWLCPPVAKAAGSLQNCGTIIIPPGIGIGPGSDVTSFNPLLVDSLYDQEAADLLFMPLLWINRFHSIDYSRSIASAVTSPDNGTTYKITLRAWHWSDNVPVTTADVAYTFALIKQLGSTYTGYGVGGMPDLIKSFTVDDATHFTVVLKKPVNSNWFILNGLQQLQPLPAHAWQRDTLDQVWQNQSSPAFFQVVDGPLVLKHFSLGLDAEFVPNPNYPGPRMHFDRFIMKFMDSEGAELQAVESHDLDISNLPFALWDAARHLPGVYLVALPASFSWHELIPNMNNPQTRFFADVLVREAIADAIDQKEIIALAMHGQGDAVYGPVPPEPATFLSARARASQYGVEYDPAKARALLRQAGYTPGPDGIMQKDGQSIIFTLMVPAGQTMRIEMAESMQQNLRAVGIEMKAHQVEFNQMLALMIGPAAGWQAGFMAQDISPFPSGEALFATGGYGNQNGYSNKTMDDLIAASTDKPGMGGLFAYEDYASAQQPVIFLPNEKYSVLVRNGLHGVENFINPLGVWSPEQLYCTAP